MAGKSPIGHPRSGCPRALLIDSFARRINTFRVEGETQIVVGASEDRASTVHDSLSSRNDLLHDDIKTINPTVFQRLPSFGNLPELVKNGFHGPSLVSF